MPGGFSPWKYMDPSDAEQTRQRMLDIGYQNNPGAMGPPQMLRDNIRQKQYEDMLSSGNKMIENKVVNPLGAAGYRNTAGALGSALSIGLENTPGPGEFPGMGALFKTPKQIMEVLAEGAPKIKKMKDLAESAEKLKHGTEVPFKNFEPTQNRYKPNHPLHQETEKFYFTDKPEVANTFSFGSEPVVLDNARIANIQMAAKEGNHIPLVVTEKGQRIPLDKLKKFKGKTVRVLDNAVSAPKVVDTNVYGHTLDISDEGTMEGLRRMLRGEGLDPNSHPLMRIRSWGDHEFSQEIPQYMRDLNLGKLKVPDAEISGGQSYLTLPEWIDYGDNNLMSIKKRLGIKD